MSNIIQTFPTSGGGGESIQLTTMPAASEQYVGKVYQYIGDTTVDYTHGYFYEGIKVPGGVHDNSYKLIPKTTASTDYYYITVDFDQTITTSKGVCKYKINGTIYSNEKDYHALSLDVHQGDVVGFITYISYLDTYIYWQTMTAFDYYWSQVEVGSGDAIQVSSFPTASATEEGNIYQYIGTTSGGFVNGYFYKCVFDGTDYSWQESPTERAETVEISKADFDLLPQAQKDNGTAYFIPDYDGGVEHTAMGFTPVGTIISMMTNHAPRHYLACNGQLVNITDYPELANHFETEFGSKNYFGGDGTTTFAVPDLRGEFLRGTGTNSHTNQGNGANVGAHQDATEHPAYLLATDNVWYLPNKVNNSAPAKFDASTNTSGGRKYSNVTETVQNDEMTETYTSRPTNTSVLYCIATHNIYLNPSLDYSTAEKIVGTWIDGKTLYQKTYTGTLSADSSTPVMVDTGLSIDSIVTIKAYAKSGNGQWKDINNYDAIGGNPDARINVGVNSNDASSNPNNIKILQTGGWSGRPYYITIQYTKTTD